MSITENLAAQYGPVFVDAFNLSITIATSNPGSSIAINPIFNGGTDAELLDTSEDNILQTGDSFLLTFVAEVNPGDEPLNNQVTDSGDAIDEDGNPILLDSGERMSAFDFSDGGTDPNASNPGTKSD